MGRIDKIPKPIDVDPNQVSSFDLIKHIKEYKEEYKDRDKRVKIAGLDPQPLMDPYEHEDSIKKLLKDIYETTACYDCPLKLLCDRRNWGKGCEFAKVVGCDLHPDQSKYPGHSTTVNLTDTSLSARLHSGYDASWTTCRDIATASSHNHDEVMWQTYNSGTQYYISRGVLLFDASSVPANSIPISARFELYCIGIGPQASSDAIQDGQPTYPHNPVVDGDLDRTNYSGDYGDLPSSACTTSTTIYFWLKNLGCIKVNGDSKHMIRESVHDIANSAPGSSTNYYLQFEGPTHAGGHDPKLMLIYNAAVGGGISRSRSVNKGGL